MKYVSDKYYGMQDAPIEVPEGGSFADMVELEGNPEIGEKINTIVSRLAEANELKGVIDVADFNDPEKLGTGPEMVERLSNLVGIFDNPALDFRRNRAEGDIHYALTWVKIKCIRIKSIRTNMRRGHEIRRYQMGC